MEKQLTTAEITTEKILTPIPTTPGTQPSELLTRFEEFDDPDHPCNKWWQEHGQYMMSGGGRREFIWSCRGWIAHEQFAAGVEVTGDSLHETKPLSASSEPEGTPNFYSQATVGSDLAKLNSRIAAGEGPRVATLPEKRRGYVLTITVAFAKESEINRAAVEAHVATIRSTSPGADVQTRISELAEGPPKLEEIARKICEALAKTKSNNGWMEIVRELLRPLFPSGSTAPDFKTLDAIRDLGELADMLHGRSNSTGFDASIALRLQQVAQTLKSIDAAPSLGTGEANGSKYKHKTNCLWATELPTGAGYWGCDCGLDKLLADLEDYEFAAPSSVPPAEPKETGK